MFWYWEQFCVRQVKLALQPRGYFQIRRSGEGLGPHIKFGGKIWGKVRPSSPNKRKNLGSSVTTRRKTWENVPILVSYLKFRGQNLGYLSLVFLKAKFGAPTRISEAKFGAPTRISEAKFGAPTRISEANFEAKPPNLVIWKYPWALQPRHNSPQVSS